MSVTVKQLGLVDYEQVWHAMQQFTQNRDANTVDELWLLQHPPVYTQGQAGKEEHLLKPNSIAVVKSDRGGQITYHGPGQFVAYTLIDIKRRKMGIKRLVNLLETSIINLLNHYAIKATTLCGAPGVYIEKNKIASVGLRIKKGCSYHGIALNVDMDLNPFKAINPCGYQQLKMVQIKDFVDDISIEQVAQQFSEQFILQLNK